MGNVSLPLCSGVWTISLVTSLQVLQTEAQKTTTARAGHEVSLSSTLLTMSKSNSGGRFAHRLCWVESDESSVWSGAIWVCLRLCQRFPASTALLDLHPIPSLISLSSRTMLLKDIFLYTSISNFPYNIQLQKHKPNWFFVFFTKKRLLFEAKCDLVNTSADPKIKYLPNNHSQNKRFRTIRPW